jgi:predicted MFS family arabinose efflux permease
LGSFGRSAKAPVAHLIVVAGGSVLAATNSMISLTITPTTVLEIGGVGAISWTTTLYVVASIVAAAAGGLLRARLGLRGAALLGPLVFVAGGLVCAAAPSMPVLLAGRLVQGLGAGLALALSYACIRILFPQRQWPRLFALISVVWAIAALAGPLVGAGLIALASWRIAYLTMAVLGVLLGLTALATLPGGGRGDAPRDGFPLAWLSGLGLAILLIAAAGNIGTLGAKVAMVAAGMALAVWLVRIDRRKAPGVLPSDAFAWSTPVGLGLWIVLALFAGGMPFGVYGVLILQVLHGQPPLTAGYVLAWEALCWSLAAIAIARLDQRYWDHALIAGPALIAAGLAGLALTLPYGNMPLIVVAATVIGSGYGVCWAFLGQRIMAGARAGEGDLAAASIATLEMTGIAVGAALAGIMGNALGVDDAAGSANLRAAAGLGHALFLPILLFAVAAATRLVRLGSTASPGDRLRPSRG